jgi:hypothetical protein
MRSDDRQAETGLERYRPFTIGWSRAKTLSCYNCGLQARGRIAATRFQLMQMLAADVLAPSAGLRLLADCMPSARRSHSASSIRFVSGHDRAQDGC